MCLSKLKRLTLCVTWQSRKPIAPTTFSLRMITWLRVQNFKGLPSFELELGSSVVFVGPNNSGKTSALQAIALLDIAIKKWYENRVVSGSKAKSRSGVSITRDDLVTIPVDSVKQLWSKLAVRSSSRDAHGKIVTSNIKLYIEARGNSQGKAWQIGFEFDYANDSLIYVRLTTDSNGNPYDFQEEILAESFGFLYPMSGLSREEEKLELGSIQKRIGEGDTSGVLRNICLRVSENSGKWDRLNADLKLFFGISLDKPRYLAASSRITVTYQQGGTKELDLANLGTGARQILLILAYLENFQSSILLMDEPDAHLEVLRQQNFYKLLSKRLIEKNSQLIVATHSEAVINSAFPDDVIVSFLSHPRRITEPAEVSQVRQSLLRVGFDQYLLAQQKGYLIYLEGSTDHSMLLSFASLLGHSAEAILINPFIHYVGNDVSEAIAHFNSLRFAFPSLRAFALFDMDVSLRTSLPPGFEMYCWGRHEIENFIPLPKALLNYAASFQRNLFSQGIPESLNEIIRDEIPPAAYHDQTHAFWKTTKISDNFLGKVFSVLSSRNPLYRKLRKSEYHLLVKFSDATDIDPEVSVVLDKIVAVATPPLP